MARKPKANSQNTTIRNVAIIFCTFILIVGALLIWNNRSLSFAGTVNNERMPIEHLHFFWNEAHEMLAWEFGGVGGPEFDAFAMEIGFEGLVELNLAMLQAEALGITLNEEDMEEVAQRAEFYRAVNTRGDFDGIAAMGFSNASFMRFVEMRVLNDKVFEHFAGLLEVTEEELEAAYEEFFTENYFNLRNVFIHIIEVEQEGLANNIWNELIMGTNFLELMREHSIVYDPENLPVDEDGEVIENVNILGTNLVEDMNQVAIAYAMEPGMVSTVIEIPNGNFVIFEVVHVEDVVDREQLEIDFKANHEETLRAEFFRDQLSTWRENAEITPNRRIFNQS